MAVPVVRSSTKSTPPVEIPLELERALFVRFWTWLGIVGSVVVVVVAGLAVVASQAVNSVVSDRLNASLAKISALESRVTDAAITAGVAQGRTSDAAAAAETKAKQAEQAVKDVQAKLQSAPDVNKLLQGTQDATRELASKPEFIASVVDAMARTDALGAGRILAVLRVKDGKLYSATTGTKFDPTTGTVFFPNSKKTAFVPLITNSREAALLTGTHWIARIDAPDRFVVKGSAQDTSGRTFPASDFTAVVVGYEPDPSLRFNE